MAQYIYTMNRVGKVVPPKRQILRDISLSFFPGAKIGVLGLNGAGKSTLLRSWPGSTPRSRARPGRNPASTSATCRRSRSSTPPRTCAATSRRPSRRSSRPLERLDKVYAAYAEPDADFDALAKEQAELENT
jgi:sulfate-transporting ATPase